MMCGQNNWSLLGGEGGWFQRNWLWILLLVIAAFFIVRRDGKKNIGKELWSNPLVMLIAVVVGICLLCAVVSRNTE